MIEGRKKKKKRRELLYPIPHRFHPIDFAFVQQAVCLVIIEAGKFRTVPLLLAIDK